MLEYEGKDHGNGWGKRATSMAGVWAGAGTISAKLGLRRQPIHAVNQLVATNVGREIQFTSMLIKWDMALTLSGSGYI